MALRLCNEMKYRQNIFLYMFRHRQSLHKMFYFVHTAVVMMRMGLRFVMTACMVMIVYVVMALCMVVIMVLCVFMIVCMVVVMLVIVAVCVVMLVLMAMCVLMTVCIVVVIHALGLLFSTYPHRDIRTADTAFTHLFRPGFHTGDSQSV